MTFLAQDELDEPIWDQATIANCEISKQRASFGSSKPHKWCAPLSWVG